MEQANFPFVTKFVRSFSDEYCVYFLTEYIIGLELFDVIREIGLVNKSQS